jgi:hypothetical protein
LVFKASRGIGDVYELTYIRKDGSRLPAEVSVTRLRDPQGAIIGYLLIGTDNTERKRSKPSAHCSIRSCRTRTPSWRAPVAWPKEPISPSRISFPA